MRAPLCPPHLLLLHHVPADDLIHGRLHKRCGDRLAVTIPIPTVGDKYFVRRNIAQEFACGLPQFLEALICRLDVVEVHHLYLSPCSTRCNCVLLPSPGLGRLGLQVFTNYGPSRLQGN